MAEIFAIGFLENLKVLFVGILMYVIIYALLTKLEVLGEKKETINALVALLAAIIVSFSGVVTYAISYAINWFVIIFFIVFLLMIIFMFLGVDAGKITAQVIKKENAKIILIAFALLFLVIVVKSFFALNNSFDINNPQNDSYIIDTSYNTGVDDITNTEIDTGVFSNIDSDVVSAVMFLLVIGVFVILMGR
ncbi:MAG: hypothetical protein PF569_09595 [Candidatus Woesearchaeota archaeon]|jgi:hypothetical protein|nr:hypothetical protein [Candidatus Woesearchaeota archaeon]